MTAAPISKDVVAEHEAQAYKDPGTPEEQTRRTFLANATLAVGGVIGLVLTVPLVASLIPESLISPDKVAAGKPVPLPKEQWASVSSKPGTPVKITFTFQYADGYFPPADDEQFVWGIKMTPDQAQSFKENRPDLYKDPAGEVKYDATDMGFVIFSSICPHLGCRFEWSPPGASGKFACPCHGSQFTPIGEKIAGPAPRGLDPLPLKDATGTAEVTWIQYKSGTPDRVIVAYS